MRWMPGFIVIMLLVLLGAFQVNAEVYQWIDKDGIIHFHNEAPQWWDSEKIVYHSKRVADKPKTLKKMGLAEDSPDYEASQSGDSAVDVKQDGNKLVFSTAQQQDIPPENNSSEGYQPKSFDELETLKPNQVIADLSARQYHGPNCRRLLRGFGKRKEYRYQLNQLRIFSSAKHAEKENFKQCPICKGKHH